MTMSRSAGSSDELVELRRDGRACNEPEEFSGTWAIADIIDEFAGTRINAEAEDMLKNASQQETMAIKRAVAIVYIRSGFFDLSQIGIV